MFQKNMGKPVKNKRKVYTIDGCSYRSKALHDLHTQYQKYREEGLIDSFALPTADVKNENKFGAKKAVVNGYVFDSVMESRYYVHLLECVKKREIQGFERQVPYVLQEKFKHPRSGKWVRAITYRADFTVLLLDGTNIVVDVKGRETADFKLKRKLFEYKYRNIDFLCLQWDEHAKVWRSLKEIKQDKCKQKKQK